MAVNLSAILVEAQRLRGFPANAQQAIQRAKGTLARRLPVEARRDIQIEYAIPAARVTGRITIKATTDAVELTASGRAVGLIEFGGRWSPKAEGAVAKVFVGEAAHTYGGTFIARGRGGNKQIFSRSFVGGKRAPRLPIQSLYGPSVASMLRKPGRIDRLADIAADVLSSEIARLL